MRIQKETAMNRKKISLLIPVILLTLAFPYSSLRAGSHEEHQHHMKTGESGEAGQAPVFVAMPDPGKKVPIGNGAYLIYGFDKKPQMGTVIMKIQAYDSKGEKDTSLSITADSGMPSMAGMHSGHHIFQLSQKGDYLAPVDITMPGDWEIKLSIVKNSKVIFRGSYKFDI
jgi:YtkA-like protein